MVCLEVHVVALFLSPPSSYGTGMATTGTAPPAAAAHDGEAARATGDRLTRAAAAIGVFAFLPFGLWAMVAPASFFEQVARFEPYNRHFVQDIGAFQLGIGAVLLLTVIRPRLDALSVGLIGGGVGEAAHAVSHIVGHDLGGKPASDIPTFTAVAVVLLVAGGVRWRRQTERPADG